MSEELTICASEIAKQILTVDKANRLIVGHFIKFLSDKGLIDLDEYLKSAKDFKDQLKASNKLGKDADLIDAYLDIHINDFIKSD